MLEIPASEGPEDCWRRGWNGAVGASRDARLSRDGVALGSESSTTLGQQKKGTVTLTLRIRVTVPFFLIWRWRESSAEDAHARGETA
jgi:hypothetical protein